MVVEFSSEGREMTDMSTKVLKDGDIVEVAADSGVVRKL